MSEHILSGISAVPNIFSWDPFAENNLRALFSVKGETLIFSFLAVFEDNNEKKLPVSSNASILKPRNLNVR